MERAPATRLTYPDLRTERLLLRRLRRTDRHDLYAYGQQPEVTRYLLWDAYRSLEDVDQFLTATLQHYQLGEPASWGLEELATGVVVGTLSYVDFQPRHRRVEIGYALAPACWGRGYMPEAIGRLLSYSFENLELNRVEARVISENAPSARVLTKCGFRSEGVLREHLLSRGAYHDVEVYSLLASEWRALQAAGNVRP